MGRPMARMIDFRDIDWDDDDLTDRERLALLRSREKMASYLYQGRSFDAHGCGAAIHIMYNALKGIDPEIYESNSEHIDL
jgi:hypothetical protein